MHRHSPWVYCCFSSMHSMLLVGSGMRHAVVGSGRAFVNTAVVLESCTVAELILWQNNCILPPTVVYWRQRCMCFANCIT